MSRRDQDYLNDIQEAIKRISEYTARLSFQQFIQDRKTQDAVIRNIEVIGEATKNLSHHVRKSNSNIPWKEMAGIRDKMIHHYFGINDEIVWEIAKKELPYLLPKIKEILKAL